MYRMRHIVTSQKGSVFLTAEFEQKVYSWNLDTNEQISVFNTQLSFGGTCLAVSEDGTHCVAAAYHRHGLSIYDILSGSVIWQRKDILKTQFTTFDTSDENVYVGFDGGSMMVIDRHTGNDVEKLRSITKIYFDSILSKRLLLRGQNTFVCDSNKIISPTFTFLDVKATGKGAVLSAVSSDLMFYDYDKQKITWKITPKKEEHFIKLAYSEKGIIYAILYKYGDSRTKPYHLLYGISALDGTIKFIFPLPMKSCEFGFAQNATKMICSSGEIYKLSNDTPKLVHHFDWD